MHPWNLNTTNALTAAAYDNLQAEKLSSALQSIYKRKYIAGYHFHEYKRLLREKLDPRLETKHPLELILAAEIDDRQFFHTLQLQVAAHVLACMQSMHALGDTLAYAIAFSLGMNLGKGRLEESKISLAAVASRLNYDPRYADLHSSLNPILVNVDYTYLADAVNQSKHRGLISADFSFDATGTSGSKYELFLPAFAFKSRTYSQRNLSGFLDPLFVWLSPQVVSVGNALNEALERSQA